MIPAPHQVALWSRCCLRIWKCFPPEFGFRTLLTSRAVDLDPHSISGSWRENVCGSGSTALLVSSVLNPDPETFPWIRDPGKFTKKNWINNLNVTFCFNCTDNTVEYFFVAIAVGCCYQCCGAATFGRHPGSPRSRSRLWRQPNWVGSGSKLQLRLQTQKCVILSCKKLHWNIMFWIIFIFIQ